MSILSVDTIQPIGSGSTVTLNAAKIVVGTGITFESNGQAIYAGIITATSFSGSGANLTSLPAANLTGTLPAISGANLTSLPAQATLSNNADNRVITGGSGVNLNGEANLTFDGSNLGINGDLVGSNNTTLYSTNGGSGVRAGLSLSGSDQSIKFYTVNGGSERLRIDSSGNIGVNEAAPSEKLQIDGDILLGGQANSSESNYAIKFEYNQHQFAKIVGDGRDSSGYGDIDFYTSTGSGVSNLTQRMTIRADGKVGIGSVTPGATLDLYSEDTEILLRLNTKPVKNGYLDIVSDANRRGIIRFQDTGGTTRWSIGKGDSDELTNTSFHISSGSSGGGAAKLSINSSGEVKIATRNSANGGEVAFRLGSFGIRTQDTGGYNWWRIDNNYGGWQSDMISLRADGNVGINTSDPTVKLSVDGGTANNATVVQIKNDSTSAYSVGWAASASLPYANGVVPNSAGAYNLDITGSSAFDTRAEDDTIFLYLSKLF